MIHLLTDSAESAVGVKVVRNEENIETAYLNYQWCCWQEMPGVDASLDNHGIRDCLHSGGICCLGVKTGVDLVLAFNFHVFHLSTGYHFCV